MTFSRRISVFFTGKSWETYAGMLMKCIHSKIQCVLDTQGFAALPEMLPGRQGPV